MPDNGAVYQPTTVGYTYDSGGDGAGGGGGFRNGFWRIVNRHKISSRKWIEWLLFSVALCSFVAGLATMLLCLIFTDDVPREKPKEIKPGDHSTTASTEVEEHAEDAAKCCIALSAGVMLVGLLLGFIWTWLRFFRRSKSPRNGMAGSSGQMLGGLNPSTDLLVGSTSQYGPVLTELPSQLKLKQANSHETTPALPLSDQEEETRTLMQDSTIPQTVSVGPNTIANQIPG